MIRNWTGLYTIIQKEAERVFKVSIQTLITPWISALLYIFVFGQVVGQRINFIEGVEYIDFVLPGILMMNVLMAAFSQSSFSLYFQRFARNIEEILVSPLSYAEMIIGYVIGSMIRAGVVGVGIYLIAVLFSAANLNHVGAFLFYMISVSIIFGFLGILTGLWAKGFEQLNILNTFVIMPLSFVGGVFNSINMLPANLQTIARFNPFFYFIDGIRYSMIGIRETNPTTGLILILVSITGLSILTVSLFRRGYGLRT
ncbi:ABC transporter permease [Candidatus Berkelbacteria bacterium]|nr:ABC transporter permease [Candidatus Berkelbacteria bacterium]